MKDSYREKISEYLERPDLDSQARHLCWIAALLSLNDGTLLREAVVSGLEDSVPPRDIREAILQSYLFVGYPKVINGFFLLEELCKEQGLDYPRDTGAIEDYCLWEKWENRGELLCRKVYGDMYDRLQKRIWDLHPLLARWMIVEGYGKVLSRDALSGGMREMLVIAILTSQGVWRQLHSHLLGGLHLGVSPEKLREVIDQLSPFLPEMQVKRALNLYSGVINSGDQ
jgi:alkylhydroperoxidase/carboxymuconolactone decarboxylase family protein YurZ